jgi:CheY-like chemotaxis protein
VHTSPCALVVDESHAARHRVSVLLQLAGWRVYEAVGEKAALRAAAELHPDLVVTDMRLRDGGGPGLIHQLRRSGSRARFLLVTACPSPRVRAQAAASGLVCLAKPVDPRRLVDFLHSRPAEPPAQTTVAPLRNVVPVVGLAGASHASGLDRLREVYLSELPHRLSAIVASAQHGDAEGVAVAARTLAGASGAIGHQEVAWLCGSIAADAQRGVLSHARLMQLVMLAAGAESRR